MATRNADANDLDPAKFPLWFTRRWYLYRLHRGATLSALGATAIVLAALVPLLPISAADSWRHIGAGAAALFWIIGAILLARGSRLLVTGAPEHRASATRLALGLALPGLGAIAAATAAIAALFVMDDQRARAGLWIGSSALALLILMVLTLWACGDVSARAPAPRRAPHLSISINLGALLVLVTLAIVILAMMSIIDAPLSLCLIAIALALIAALCTLASLAARSLLGGVILAREIAEIGPEIEPVSGP